MKHATGLSLPIGWNLLLEKQGIFEMAVIFAEAEDVSANIIIVAKTRMKQGYVCIGAYDVDNKVNIRLLTVSGNQQPESCELEVGRVVRASYVRVVAGIVPPHTEDVRLKSFAEVSQGQKIKDDFVKYCQVIAGPVTNTFSGCLSREGSGSLSIRKGNVPDHSVCFWKTDQIIRLNENSRERFGSIKYIYGPRDSEIGLPFVGMKDPIQSIQAGTVVRLSLARWWKPNNAAHDDKRCQLQLSGWYP